MNYPVPKFDYYDNLDFRNGTPAFGVHALKLDQFGIHLATLKRSTPQMMGQAWESGTCPSYQRVTAPFWTKNMRVVFFATGKGTISLTVDGNTDTRAVAVGLGTSHSYANALPVEVASTFSLTNQDSVQIINWSFDITDAGGGATLKVWQIEVHFTEPAPAAALP